MAYVSQEHSEKKLIRNLKAYNNVYVIILKYYNNVYVHVRVSSNKNFSIAAVLFFHRNPVDLFLLFSLRQ